jgi:hypothetical protein
MLISVSKAMVGATEVENSKEEFIHRFHRFAQIKMHFLICENL